MADNDDYEILYLKYLEKIGLTPPRAYASDKKQASDVKCQRTLFQNIKFNEDNYQQPNYQRINLTSRQIQLKEQNQLEIDSIIPSTSEDKSPMQEIQTSLLQPSEVKQQFTDEQINDHSNNTNICYKINYKEDNHEEQHQQQIEQEQALLDEQDNNQLIKQEEQRVVLNQNQEFIQFIEPLKQEIQSNIEQEDNIENFQNKQFVNEDSIIHLEEIKICENQNNQIFQQIDQPTNQQIQEQEIQDSEFIKLEKQFISQNHESEPLITVANPVIEQSENQQSNMNNQQEHQVIPEIKQIENLSVPLQQSVVKSKKIKKREKQKQRQKLKKNKKNKKSTQGSNHVQENQVENRNNQELKHVAIPVVINPVCNFFNQLIAGLNCTKINWSKYKCLQKKIKKKRSILQRSKQLIQNV